MRTRLAAAAVSVLVSVTLGGCASLGLPAPASTATSASATGTDEVPTPAALESAPGADSAEAAVTDFATAYINWDARGIGAHLRRLAGDSIGQARSAMQLAAAQTAGDYELARGGIANHGTVEAVARLSGGGNRYVVVTRELTTATATSVYAGLRPAWHVTVAAVTRLGPGRWVVSGWQPEG